MNAVEKDQLRCEGIAMERGRVRFKLSTQEAFDEVFEAISHNVDDGFAAATKAVFAAIASRLGIDLSEGGREAK